MANTESSILTAQEPFQMDMVLDRLFVLHGLIGDGANHDDIDKKLADIADTMVMLFSQNIGAEDVKARLDRVYEYRQQLNALLALPKLEQRTPLWYEKRSGMITASDYAQAINKGKFGTQRDFFAKKCGYEVDNFDCTMAPLVWGIKYEQVANDAYTKKNAGLRVHEFGLLEHPEMSFLGASPDGITDTGVMLEIKCPFRRKINGTVPQQYYYQIQGQLDVCNLEECDYCEAELLEYGTKDEFKRHFHDNSNFKGIIIETKNADQQYLYVDPRIWSSLPDQLDWLSAQTSALGDQLARVFYWQLYKYSVIRVYRDKAFIAKLYEDLTPGHPWIPVFRFFVLPWHSSSCRLGGARDACLSSISLRHLQPYRARSYVCVCRLSSAICRAKVLVATPRSGAKLVAIACSASVASFTVSYEPKKASKDREMICTWVLAARNAAVRDTTWNRLAFARSSGDMMPKNFSVYSAAVIWSLSTIWSITGTALLTTWPPSNVSVWVSIVLDTWRIK